MSVDAEANFDAEEAKMETVNETKKTSDLQEKRVEDSDDAEEDAIIVDAEDGPEIVIKVEANTDTTSLAGHNKDIVVEVEDDIYIIVKMDDEKSSVTSRDEDDSKLSSGDMER